MKKGTAPFPKIKNVGLRIFFSSNIWKTFDRCTDYGYNQHLMIKQFCRILIRDTPLVREITLSFRFKTCKGVSHKECITESGVIQKWGPNLLNITCFLTNSEK